ncbi:restriction endonuclease subunit S [Enterococcus casseliflavus]|uniref:restriction endonuclease subunit S n=1 Tax=Enterococcus casseliflavus TaxID=37734 RepID=UPI00232D885C|nr:restriction endonuclease subunit S [Enterococcus casseliflavus]MDB1696450.1 restriction endonuclease subunit S [Enterococcus casseliflavus]MDB1699454.1 restriction endonuclease subunit S [Enterococcus casseliflavus]MDB1701680.1 restriction endonuclease subunit S [Enterococcus casseliflavus]MDB1706617.1 restriction endonuclease subunit S [Enterococcus casseliflavus]
MVRKKIEDLGKVISGGTPSTKNERYWGGDIAWITPKDLSKHDSMFIFKGERGITEEGLKNSSAYTVPTGTVLFSSRAPIGYVAIAGKNLTTNQGFKNIVVNDENDNLFIYYLLKNNIKFIESHANGSTFKEISAKVFKNLEFDVPNLDTQRKISKILSTLDSKIELNNQIISNLEELASTLFKRWFVDFEFPDENGNPYKSSGGKMVDSELGEIPEGWGIKKLGEISRIQNGYAFKSKDYIEYSVDNSVKVLRTLNINNDNLTINNKDLVYLPEFFLKHHSNVVLNKFDTLFVMVGATIGKVGLVTDINLPSLQNQNMWRFRPDFPHLSSVILRHYVIHSRNIAENWKTGSAREFYRKDSFSNIRLAIAENRILDKLNSMLQPIYELINKKNYENGQLEGLRDSLLPKLLSGEIELPEDEEV